MIDAISTPHFKRIRKKYVKNNLRRAQEYLFALNSFRHDPSHPGLNTEKLVNSETWSMRINRSDRIFFMWIDDTSILLLDIGPHDKYRKV